MVKSTLTVLISAGLAAFVYYVIYRWTKIVAAWAWVIALLMIAPSVEGFFAPTRTWSGIGAVTTTLGILGIAWLVKSKAKA